MPTVAVFDANPHDGKNLTGAARVERIEWRFHDLRPNPKTAAAARAVQVACVFVNDRADRETLGRLAEAGVPQPALRCTRFTHVDLADAARHLDLAAGTILGTIDAKKHHGRPFGRQQVLVPPSGADGSRTHDL